jgi:hypothetical protein
LPFQGLLAIRQVSVFWEEGEGIVAGGSGLKGMAIS